MTETINIATILLIIFLVVVLSRPLMFVLILAFKIVFGLFFAIASLFR